VVRKESQIPNQGRQWDNTGKHEKDQQRQKNADFAEEEE